MLKGGGGGAGGGGRTSTSGNEGAEAESGGDDDDGVGEADYARALAVASDATGLSGVLVLLGQMAKNKSATKRPTEAHTKKQHQQQHQREQQQHRKRKPSSNPRRATNDVVTFDAKERIEFVKGFGKRKQERKERSKQRAIEREREVRKLLRQKRKEARQKGLDAARAIPADSDEAVGKLASNESDENDDK